MTTTTPEAPQSAIAEAIEQAPSVALVEFSPDSTASMKLARKVFPKPVRKEIALFLNIAEDNPAMMPFLSAAAQLGLNPFLGEIWLIEKKKRGQDAAPSDKQYQVMVGRDGLLKAARRVKEYAGYDAQVVCDNDQFEVEYTGDVALDPVVRHKQSPMKRGAIQGAWCKVYVRGMRPTFYYAPFREHAQIGTRSSDGGEYLMGAWNHKSAMALKAAVSYAHRLAVGVTGIVPADEIGQHGEAILEAQTQSSADLEEANGEVLDALDLPGELRGELFDAIKMCNEVKANSWSPAKVRMRLQGRSEEEARAVVEEIRDEVNASLDADIADEEEQVTDAEVVEEEEGQPPGAEEPPEEPNSE